MPTFIGFNTINQFKKFTLVDFELIKRDLANAFNIQQGELPGRPGYGTTIWGYVFESQTPETEQGILQEIQRVAGGDQVPGHGPAHGSQADEGDDGHADLR